MSKIMEINQKTVDQILKLARESSFGLDDERACDYKQGNLKIDGYANPDFDSLAMCLVNGFHSKYDLISVFSAALKVVEMEGIKMGMERK